MVVIVVIFILIGLSLPVYNGWNIAQEINNKQTQEQLKVNFNRTYNYQDLLIWEHQNLNFSRDKLERYINPVKILNNGKGRCGEFAILYAAICETNGYDTRFVVNLFGDHAWVQINLNGTWIHVDPSLSINDSRTYDPFIYERDWKTPPIIALAFDTDSIQDITSSYRQGFWINIISFQMLLCVFLLFYAILFLCTFSKLRRGFYIISFQNKYGRLRKIGNYYEKHLHKLYLIRLLCTFLAPVALGVLLYSNTNQDFLLNLILIGFALLTFSFIELPALTRANIFISQIENCNGNLKCIYKENNSCKARESYVYLNLQEERVFMFRLQNLSLHTLKNCKVWFTFPNNFEIKEVDKNEDFYKHFILQRRNNACFFPSHEGFTISPSDCFVFPINLKLLKKGEKTDKVYVQFSCDTTWGTSESSFKIKYDIDSYPDSLLKLLREFI